MLFVNQFLLCNTSVLLSDKPAVFWRLKLMGYRAHSLKFFYSRLTSFVLEIVYVFEFFMHLN